MVELEESEELGRKEAYREKGGGESSEIGGAATDEEVEKDTCQFGVAS